MLTEVRQKKIYEYIRKHGTAKVADLHKLLNVSDMTIRRDLNELTERGLITRVHGGAIINDIRELELSFQSRQVKYLEQKMAIARLAKESLFRNATIYLDGSTTCNELAKLLSNDMDLIVFTDSLAVFLELQNRDGVDTILFGGMLEKDNNTLDGVLTVATAEKITVDLCFFSARGFSVQSISNAGMIGTNVKRIMLKNSKTRYLLADSSKFNQKGLFELCSWSDVDALITDSCLESENLQLLKAHGIDVRIAKLEEGAKDESSSLARSGQL